MGNRPFVTSVRLSPTIAADVERGLLGWLSFDIDGTWHVDGVALRRTRSGRLALSFPARDGRGGFRRTFLRPTCDRARLEIERAVLATIEERLELLRAAPCRGAIDAAGEDEQAEEGRPGGHGRQGTAGSAKR